MAELATKAQILASKPKERELEVPEWGGTIKLREMSGRDRDKMEFEVQQSDAGLDNFRARLVARCIVNGDGKRMFTDAEILELGRTPGGPLGKVADACQELNGYGAEQVEELAGN